jgi:uncharacterized protein (DUF1800 family)
MKNKQSFFICMKILMLGSFLQLGFSTTAAAALPAKCYDPTRAPVYPATTGTTVITPTAQAARFLNMASFGATAADINHLSKMTPDQWLTEQFGLDASCHLATLNQTQGNNQRENRMEVWFRLSDTAPDQLRQRVAFALSEIFVVSDVGSGITPNAMAVYYDVLVRNAFGNFSDILNDVTLSPAMGRFLSMLGNQKPNKAKGIRADENYAREVMQLFTIGLVKLDNNGNPSLNSSGSTLPTYTQAQVEGIAKTFTGWTWGNSIYFTDGNDWRISMKPFLSYHDRSQKEIVTSKLIPALGTPEADLALALNTIFKHPNVGPFIAKRLIQRLVTSNPSPEYIDRVATAFNNNGQGVRGDMKAVIRAILLDNEALTGKTANPNFGKLREPLIAFTHLWRAFAGNAADGTVPYYYPESTISQAPLSAPSVFNFFKPDYAPSRAFESKGLVAPEFQLVNEANVTSFQNALYAQIEWSYKQATNASLNQVQIDISTLRKKAINPADLVNYLDLILTGSQTPSTVKSVLVTYLQGVALETGVRSGVVRSLDALYLMMSSPYYLIQR